MTAKNKLPIEIVAIEPCAVYKGTVYDQTVIARLQDGTPVSLFDLTPISTTDDMIGKNLQAEVSLLPANDGASWTVKPVGVYPPTEQLSEWSHDIIGEIIAEELTAGPVPLDISCGTVYTPMTEEMKEMANEIGTLKRSLYLHSSRLDLNECVQT